MKLRGRAAALGTSLAAYARHLLIEDAAREDQDAAQETMVEVLARIATREPVELTGAEIIAAIREGR